MIPALQRFIGKPDDIDALLKDIEAQKTNIFQVTRLRDPSSLLAPDGGPS